MNDKLAMQTPNWANINTEKLAELFPHCVTETADGLKVDFDLLKQELSSDIIDGTKERYRLEWPGKREAIVTANLPTTKTLRPVIEDSVEFDTTENLYIEGDNLEVLKLLQESYLGKIKMIYIDPPYNTGNDFVYKDNFSKALKEELEESGQKDEYKQRLVVNPETNGRYHSDWLTMIYPRLKLARNLMTEDGVIFISIDDNEVHNLRKVCDEIFGGSNFVCEFIWKRRASSALSDNNVSTDHEYVLAYQKGLLRDFVGIEKDFRSYLNPDNDHRGPWVLGDLTVGMNSTMRPNQAYDLVDPETKKEYPFNPNRVWAYIPESMKKLIEEKRIHFPDSESKRPMLKRFQKDLNSNFNPVSSLLMDRVGMNTEATKVMQDTMGGNIFEYSKPLSLIKVLISQIANEPKDIVLDFFAGASTTSHAMFEQTAKDTILRKFICIQLPEQTDQRGAAYAAGYKDICEIGKERIRRAAEVVKEEKLEKAKKDGIFADFKDTQDYGFRVYRLDESNMQDVYYKPQDYEQSNLDLFADNIKADRTAEDLLAQVMLDWGLPLSLKIERKNIAGKEVFAVAENSLYACFDKDIDETFAKELAKDKPLRIVFRDKGFKDDTAKENVKQLLEQLSASTEMRVL